MTVVGSGRHLLAGTDVGFSLFSWRSPLTGQRRPSGATARSVENDWQNVHLIGAPIDRAAIEVTADAALFCAVHDILQSPSALANVFEHLRPGELGFGTGYLAHGHHHP